ncbi:hypothetical protein SAMN05216583_10414 [Selenomonas sp. KH1T6]|nr:hypothetical protein SAMN05216583_10414 [Selenomonas ruminantium]
MEILGYLFFAFVIILVAALMVLLVGYHILKKEKH